MINKKGKEGREGGVVGDGYLDYKFFFFLSFRGSVILIIGTLIILR